MNHRGLHATLAKEVMLRCEELGKVSEESGCLTRTFHSEAMGRANRLVSAWMEDLGMLVREDAAFNLIGRKVSTKLGAKCVIIGSHLDTVRNAGKFDGPLGVMLGIAVVRALRDRALPFHLEVVGFSDEEGVRYQTTYLGSRSMCGMLKAGDLARVEEKGIEKAKRSKSEMLAYLEAHIEQGPVLEAMGRPVGVVSAIAGQTRIRVEIIGRAGHAGTTPMNLREDALCGAAEIVLAAEKLGVLATVGELEVVRGASNVIPGEVHFTLDIRDAKDSKRMEACEKLRCYAEAVASRRGLRMQWKRIQETGTSEMDKDLTDLLLDVARGKEEVPLIPSGAGHDAAVMSRCCPSAMLFVRCKGGISHHPAESVKESDVAIAVGVMIRTIEELAKRHG